LPLVNVTPRDVGDFLDSLVLAIPSKKLHRAALNHFFDFQVQRHAVVLNPVSSVRNERYQVAEGKTPEITVKQARRLFGAIESSTVVSLRDRAAIAVLAYSGSRIGAVARLRRQVNGQDLLPRGNLPEPSTLSTLRSPPLEPFRHLNRHQGQSFSSASGLPGASGPKN